MQNNNFLNLSYVQQWVLCFIAYKGKINTDISYYLDDSDLCEKISSMMTYDNYSDDIKKLNKEISQLVTYDIIKDEMVPSPEYEYDEPSGYYVLTRLGILYIRDKLIIPLNLLKDDATYSKLKNKCDKNNHTLLDRFRGATNNFSSRSLIAEIIIKNTPEYLPLINIILKHME